MGNVTESHQDKESGKFTAGLLMVVSLLQGKYVHFD